MRSLIIALVLTCCPAGHAWAQSQGFVDGNMFADLKRFSSTNSGTSTFSGNAVGGGGRVGVIVAERWSVSLAIDQGASTSRSTAIPIALPLSILLPIPQLQAESSNRLLAVSALVGYHASARHRVRPAVMGGLTFMHVWRRSAINGPIPLALSSGTLVIPPLVVRPTELVDNVPAGTVGAEAAIQLTDHFAAVPHVRAHAFSVTNGPSGFAIRPGIAVRWTF